MTQIKHKGILFNLGGQMVVIPAITKAELEKLKVRSNNFSDDLAYLPAFIDAIHSAILRNYPNITREAVAESVDFSNLEKLVNAVMDVHGKNAAKLRRLDS